MSDQRPQLSNDEIKRYSRHLIMPEVGVDGQRSLKAGSVLCIGAGGLGSPAAMYLAAAGVGRIGIVDFDVVDFSNLQRQIIHGTPDVGRSKLASARDRLHAINPHVQIDTYETALSSENALQLFEPYDVILDGTDNFPTRYLVNDACVMLGKPNRPLFSPPSRALATGASILSPRRLDWFQAAPKAASSACCRVSSV
jgi:sulfur-carrier protein adenylyltransferase/sulfurtransferase